MQLPIFSYATIPCPAALLLPCDSGISSLPERHSPIGDAVGRLETFYDEGTSSAD